MKKGFTLVELSIVLVIIGLLIGGILAAQSMISTAKVVAVTAQLSQFDAGVENFKTKYNYLPGDAPAFGGDGDGLITLGQAAGYGTAVNSYGGEIANFWGDLFNDKFTTIGNTTPGTYPQPTGLTPNVPLSKIGSPGSFFMASAAANASYLVVSPSPNYYAIIGSSSIRTTVTNCCYQLIPNASGVNPPSTPAVKPPDALALDQKIDDGNGLTGNVKEGMLFDILPDDSGALIEPSVSTPPANCVSAMGVYNINISAYTCTPIIRIGASVNDPQ